MIESRPWSVPRSVSTSDPDWKLRAWPYVKRDGAWHLATQAERDRIVTEPGS